MRLITLQTVNVLTQCTRCNIRYNMVYSWLCECKQAIINYTPRCNVSISWPMIRQTITTDQWTLDFVRDNWGELVPAETFTHSHLLWPSVIPYQLPPSIMIHDILAVQFMCHNLSPSFLWSTSRPGTLHFTLHTFLHPIIVFFLQHMPIPSQPVLLQYRGSRSKAFTKSTNQNRASFL